MVYLTFWLILSRIRCSWIDKLCNCDVLVNSVELFLPAKIRIASPLSVIGGQVRNFFLAY